MLSSGIAQAATNLWKRHTLALLGIILVAHIACFAVIVTQIEARHANAVSVNTIALSMAYASQSLLRINFMVSKSLLLSYCVSHQPKQAVALLNLLLFLPVFVCCAAQVPSARVCSECLLCCQRSPCNLAQTCLHALVCSRGAVLSGGNSTEAWLPMLLCAGLLRVRATLP
jgi:hypothetical protein